MSAMYLTNKYTTTYYKIIDRAIFRDLSGYSEKHHVIPKSLGGTDESSNIVRLTAKEHFICHLLLVKMTTGTQRSKMAQAAWMMVSTSSTQNRYKITGKTYQFLKEEMSLSKKGITTWNKGKSPSDETKRKLRAATLNHLVKQGKLTEEEAAFRNSQPLGPKPKDPKKKRKSASGWKWSEEDRRKLSESRKGRTPWNKGKRRI
jgi:hypothetical protein